MLRWTLCRLWSRQVFARRAVPLKGLQTTNDESETRRSEK
jgi:hypothetical protein